VRSFARQVPGRDPNALRIVNYSTCLKSCHHPRTELRSSPSTTILRLPPLDHLPRNPHRSNLPQPPIKHNQINPPKSMRQRLLRFCGGGGSGGPGRLFRGAGVWRFGIGRGGRRVRPRRRLVLLVVAALRGSLCRGRGWRREGRLWFGGFRRGGWLGGRRGLLG
jgi:hypothetical protein